MSSVLSDAEKALLDQAASNFGDGVVNLGRDPSMFNLDSFTLNVTFELNDLESGRQTLVNNHKQYSIEIIDNDLAIWLNTEEGTRERILLEDAIDTAGWHDTQVVLDADAGTLEIWFDGQSIYSGSSEGFDIGEASYWDVSAGGTAWGQELNGQIADVSILDQAVEIDSSISLYERMYEIDEADTASQLAAKEPVIEAPQVSDEEMLEAIASDFGEGVVNLGRDPSMFDLESFTVSVTFDLNDLKSGRQTLINNHKQYSIEVNNNDLMVWLNTDEGVRERIFMKDVIEAPGWHDIQVVLDDEAGALNIWMDGKTIFSGSSEGYAIGGVSYYDVTAGGTAWGRELNGKIADLSLIHI